jgi:hypothetical protein
MPEEEYPNNEWLKSESRRLVSGNAALECVAKNGVPIFRAELISDSRSRAPNASQMLPDEGLRAAAIERLSLRRYLAPQVRHLQVCKPDFLVGRMTRSALALDGLSATLFDCSPKRLNSSDVPNHCSQTRGRSKFRNAPGLKEPLAAAPLPLGRDSGTGHSKGCPYWPRPRRASVAFRAAPGPPYDRTRAQSFPAMAREKGTGSNFWAGADFSPDSEE